MVQGEMGEVTKNKREKSAIALRNIKRPQRGCYKDEGSGSTIEKILLVKR